MPQHNLVVMRNVIVHLKEKQKQIMLFRMLSDIHSRTIYKILARIDSNTQTSCLKSLRFHYMQKVFLIQS